MYMYNRKKTYTYFNGLDYVSLLSNYGNQTMAICGELERSWALIVVNLFQVSTIGLRRSVIFAGVENSLQ